MSETNCHPGRGPRLPHTRITVQDLLPYLKAGDSDDEIARRHPTIGLAEVRLFRQYFLDHTEDVLVYEQEVTAYHEDLRKEYNRPSALDSLSPEDRIRYLKDKLAKKVQAEANGAHHTTG